MSRTPTRSRIISVVSSSTRTTRGWLLALGGVTVLALLVHIAVGAGHLGLGEVIRHLAAGDTGGNDPVNAIVWKMRLPRALGALVAGAALGMVGSAFQALFRNPLAEPYIVGVSSGAAVGGTLALVFGFGGMMGGLGTALAATVTGLLTLALVFGLARRHGAVDVETLLLAGVVVGTLLGSLVTLLIYVSGENPLHILRWLLGSITPMNWEKVGMMATAAIGGSVILLAQAKRLNVYAVGEDTARRLGVNVRRLKPVVLVTGAAMTAITVGAVGVIGFLGLVAPHLSRRLLGVDWRSTMVASAWIGATLLVLADLIAQRAYPGGEIPVGVVTALLGAPSLLILLRRAG